MAEQLSQADIDALLDTFSSPGARGAAEGDTPAAPAAGGRAPAYDFSHPDLLSREQARALRTIHEGFAQALSKRLATELLTNVSVSVVSIDHLTYAEFLMLLPNPTVLSVIEVPQLEGNIAIELNPNVAFAFVDRLLGGEGKPVGKLRALTAIEQGLMERVLGRCCQELGALWAPVLPLGFELAAIEGNPGLARVVGQSEMVVLVALELRMNDVSGMLNLCLPYVVMEPAIQRLSLANAVTRKSDVPPAVTRAALEGSLGAAPATLDVELGGVELSVGEILALEPGDVLRFTPGNPAGARALVEGEPRFAGSAGRSRGHLAFRVAGPLGPTPSSTPEE